MPRPALPQELIERIKSAPIGETTEAIAARLGVSTPTVKKYRRQAREERQEVAREVIARHVEANVPDALQDLSDLRRLAREKYEATGDPRQAQVWLGAVKVTLEHVKPDDADLDAAIETELARAAQAREGAAAGPAAGPQQHAAAYH